MLSRILFSLVLTSFWLLGYGAEPITPTISPSFFEPSNTITVTYDVTGTSLAALTEAYIWVWIPGENIDAKYNINPASSNPTVTNVIGPNGPKFTKSVVSGRTLFTITFTPSAFFTQDISNEVSLGMLLKADDWSAQTTDYIASFGFKIQLNLPSQLPVFVDNGEDILIDASTSLAADFELYINEILIDSKSNITSYTYTHTVPEITGYAEVRLHASAVSNSSLNDEVQFRYFISANSPSFSRPPGIIAGINYQTDATKVTLCLWAPGKNSVYVMGDFNNWNISTDQLMNRDGEFFWIELDELTAGEEYAFRYLVDETILVADPYADKILDPDDQYIPASTYPGLKSFPVEALRSNWYENRVSVFQTGQTPYVWQVNDFQKPDKENLVVYELLIRDFFDSNNRNYQSLIDTIGYFKRLGINAIELMPVMEFNGNEGWGYNPTFMFAPDKYYGTKNKLKEFVDVCHQNGIAVILDIAMNHQDVPNTYVSMYFDYNQFKPTANNPWFNVTAKHPFSVFFDMNHASSYTMQYLDTVNYYWLNEYKVDGFRFDLSKGFTQKLTTDVGVWGNYDASRVFILKRMADAMWQHTPDTYIVLEHFADNSEEKELAEYRSGEGKGMMLWGKMTDPYNQNTMGYSSNSDISGVYFKNRSWAVPRLMSYMESHDEERLMFKNFEYGNESGDYSVKSETTALRRMRAAGLVFFTIPGPKMIWQFGELGYDQSINTCSDGSINPDCRLSAKPLPWSYQGVHERDGLFEHTADLLRLRNEYDVFTSGDATISGGTSLLKQITIKNNPYTATPINGSEMNVQIAVNFDVVANSIDVNFPHTGTWYDYYAHGLAVNVTSTPFAVEFQPGGYKLFTDVEIVNPLVTSVNSESDHLTELYPNPTHDFLRLNTDIQIVELKLRALQGITMYPKRLPDNTWDISQMANGLYIAEVKTVTGFIYFKVIKN